MSKYRVYNPNDPENDAVVSTFADAKIAAESLLHAMKHNTPSKTFCSLSILDKLENWMLGHSEFTSDNDNIVIMVFHDYEYETIRIALV